MRAASGRSDEEAADGLEELLAARPRARTAAAEAAYDFAHEKLRELVYEQTGLARRRLLHRRVADALCGRRRVRAQRRLVAQHLRLAGDRRGGRRAAPARRGARRVGACAHADALDHLEAALALGYPDAAALHERIGDLRTLIGDYGGRSVELRDSGGRPARAPTLARARAQARRRPSAPGRVGPRRGALHRRARGARRRGRRTAGPHPRRPRLTLHHAGQPERAPALAARGPARSPRPRPTTRTGAGPQHARRAGPRRGRLDAPRSELERSLALAEQLDDQSAETAALNNLALVERDAGELASALELTEQALALCAAARRPPPRGGAREQPRRPPSRRRPRRRVDGPPEARRRDLRGGRRRRAPPGCRRSGSSSAGSHAGLPDNRRRESSPESRSMIAATVPLTCTSNAANVLACTGRHPHHSAVRAQATSCTLNPRISCAGADLHTTPGQASALDDRPNGQRACERIQNRRADSRLGRHARFGPAPARRLFATTTRRVCRGLSSSAVCGRRACRRSRGPCGDAGNNPCRRQADQVVAPARRGAGYWSRTTIGASGRTPISSSPRRGGGRRPPVLLSQCAHARMDVPVGEGFARPRSGRSRDVRPWPQVCAAFARGCGSPLARTARSLVDDEQEPSVGSAVTDGDGSVPHVTGPSRRCGQQPM